MMYVLECHQFIETAIEQAQVNSWSQSCWVGHHTCTEENIHLKIATDGPGF